MGDLIQGIHHVTALAGDPQKCLDFYAGVLGLRLVKKTVNFDAPDVYHLYLGDEAGRPGTILTFFPYGTIPQGRPGNGMAASVAFSVPTRARPFWEERLARFGVRFEPAPDRFPSETVIQFADGDGLSLRLAFTEVDAPLGYGAGPIASEDAIRGFHAIELWEESLEPTRALLCDYLGHHLVARSGDTSRFSSRESAGCYIDILVRPRGARGRGGKGTVHHVAFATEDCASQTTLRGALGGIANPTPIIDRQYFTSVYFHEPGGVLFEVATLGPGFAVDEPLEALGGALKLPPQYEPARGKIEAELAPIALDTGRYR